MVNIIIPRKQLILPGYMRTEAAIAGYIQVEKAKCDSEGRELPGTRHIALPWFKNTVTDIGLNQKGHGVYNSCYLGTGTSPILTSSTSLGSYLGQHNSKIGDGFFTGQPSGINNTVAPYYGWTRGTYRFNAGNCTGVLSEVGISNTSVVGGGIFCGSLLKDIAGNPTTITKLADELLDISYEVRMYPKLTDDTYVVNLNGTDHTFTSRAWMNSPASWGYTIFNPAPFPGTYSPTNDPTTYYKNLTLANLGNLVTPMSGVTNIASNYPSYATYTDGTLFMEATLTLGPSVGNDPAGISGITNSTGVGMYKHHITPAIPKALGTNLQMKYRYYWTRYII